MSSPTSGGSVAISVFTFFSASAGLAVVELLSVGGVPAGILAAEGGGDSPDGLEAPATTVVGSALSSVDKRT
jgi:hypothetical protein